MAEPIVLEHIRSWQAAGLIDDLTARRLRDAETREATAEGPAAIERPAAPARGISAVEVLVWLGVGLVLAAWYWEVTSRAPSFGTARSTWLAVGAAIPALLAAVAGLAARRPAAFTSDAHGRGGRLARAAGPLLLASGVQLAFVGYFVADLVLPADEEAKLTIGALVWLAAAASCRRLEPGFPTTTGVVASILAVAMFGQEWLAAWLFGRPDWSGEMVGGVTTPGPAVPFIGAAWWLVTAVIVGLLAEVELRSRDAGGLRRAFAVRLVAGLVAVLGVASSLLATSWPTGPGASDMLDPLVADAALLSLALVLGLLAAAARTSAWLYPAALATVIALSDLDARLLADAIGMGPALLVEGVVLIGAGAGTEAARRRISRRRSGDGPSSGSMSGLPAVAGVAVEPSDGTPGTRGGPNGEVGDSEPQD